MAQSESPQTSEPATEQHHLKAGSHAHQGVHTGTAPDVAVDEAGQLIATSTSTLTDKEMDRGSNSQYTFRLSK